MRINVHSEYESDALYYNHCTKSRQRSEDYSRHYHDVTELLFVKSGDVRYEVGEKKYDLKKNTLVISRPEVSHCIYSEGDSDYERYNMLFDEKRLPFELYDRIPRDLNVISFEGNKNVIGAFERMDSYCQRLRREDLESILFGIINEILINVIIATEGERATAAQLTPTVQEAVKYIEENLCTVEGIDEICRELYISKSHLHHLFATELDTSPKKYILDRRLDRARQALATGERATEIYSECGFGDYSSFFRAYKKRYGYSPADTPKNDVLRITFSDMVKGHKV